MPNFEISDDVMSNIEIPSKVISELPDYECDVSDEVLRKISIPNEISTPTPKSFMDLSKAVFINCTINFCQK